MGVKRSLKIMVGENLDYKGYHTGAGKKGEITLSDVEDHNRQVQAIKTLTDSEHEDEQASDDELALIEELSCLDTKEERLKREK